MDGHDLTSLLAQVSKLLDTNVDCNTPWLSDIKNLLSKIGKGIDELEQENTALLKAQTSIEDLLNIYSDLFSLAPASYVVTDLNLKVIKANTAFCEMFKIGKDMIEGMSILNLTAAESTRNFINVLKKLQESNYVSCQTTMKNGNTNVIMYMTALKSTNEYRFLLFDASNFKNNEDQLHSLMNISSSLLACIDANTHRILYISDNVKNLLGITPAAITGASAEQISQYLAAEHQSKYFNLTKLVEEAEANGENGYNCLFTIVGENDIRKSMHGHFALVHNEDCSTSHIAAEIYETNDSPDSQPIPVIDKDKANILSDISREVYYSIDSISRFADMLKKSLKKNSRDNKFVDTINICANKSKNLLSSLSIITRIELNQDPINKNLFDINTLLSDIFNIYSDSASSKGLTLICSNLSNKVPLMVNSDIEKIQIVMSNLIDNAIKYTETGSVSFNADVTDGILHFCVKDTGIGISKNKASHIFDSLPTSDEFTTKSGLGLQISDSIVRMLGGKLVAESEKGAGSTFRFSIPV